MDSGELAKAWTGQYWVIGNLQLELVQRMANHFQSSETKLAKVRFDQLDIRPNVSATSSPNLVWKKTTHASVTRRYGNKRAAISAGGSNENSTILKQRERGVGGSQGVGGGVGGLKVLILWLFVEKNATFWHVLICSELNYQRMPPLMSLVTLV